MASVLFYFINRAIPAEERFLTWKFDLIFSFHFCFSYLFCKDLCYEHRFHLPLFPSENVHFVREENRKGRMVSTILSVMNGKRVTVQFYSQILWQVVTYSVLLTAGPGPYPVVLQLHGFGGN